MSWIPSGKSSLSRGCWQWYMNLERSPSRLSLFLARKPWTLYVTEPAKCFILNKKSLINLTFNSRIYLKWQCHEMFWPFLLHESNPSGHLINRLKWFCLKISFCLFIREISDSAQAYTAWSQTLRRLTLRGVEFFQT